MRKLLPLFILAFPVCVLAETQMATVTSTGAFQLRGAGVTPGQGVPSWPAMPGDVVKAGSTPVTFTFPDGSSVILDPQSVARIEMSGSTPMFKLQSGSMHYSLKSPTAIKLAAMDKPVAATHVSGIVKIANGKVSTSWGTPGHTGAVVGTAAASTAAGIAVTEATSGGPAVSPSK